MELFGSHATINVSFTVEDWGSIIAAVSMSDLPIQEKMRLNEMIFENARQTECASA